MQVASQNIYRGTHCNIHSVTNSCMPSNFVSRLLKDLWSTQFSQCNIVSAAVSAPNKRGQGHRPIVIAVFDSGPQNASDFGT